MTVSANELRKDDGPVCAACGPFVPMRVKQYTRNTMRRKTMMLHPDLVWHMTIDYRDFDAALLNNNPHSSSTYWIKRQLGPYRRWRIIATHPNATSPLHSTVVASWEDRDLWA